MTTTAYLRTDTIPVDKLTPYPGNAKRGDVGAILASLRKNGQYRGLVVREQPDGALVVLAGNHTRQALFEHGPGDCGTKGCGVCGNSPHWVPSARCDVIQCDDQTALRVNLADNRTADLGSYDYAGLAELLGSLGDVDGTGYSDQDVQDITNLVALPDEEPKDDNHTAARQAAREASAGGLDGGEVDTGNPEVFNPVINLRVPHAVFDRWRNALDAHPGQDDAAKLLGLLDEVEASRAGAAA
ncbi:ParB N-terminal domain-containing protein [Streptomyces sp. KAU_LT]|uniref:ParB N-terminal domain-containing protein n=1 Tax=Streptomyces sp. KAU_LT TaxID=3046669 RepID=UPI0024B74F12|nr:ParB N-terminal domain-containing protein [Streptomyces sp. KAU_LT]MDI9829714.1 ParB N-terminal domain-containing protein [Streptomyces sp. KAU_LT]